MVPFLLWKYIFTKYYLGGFWKRKSPFLAYWFLKFLPTSSIIGASTFIDFATFVPLQSLFQPSWLLERWEYTIWQKIDFNTQYMRNSTILYPVKMEYGWNLWLNFFCWNPSMRKQCHFYYWICTFDSFNRKWLSHGGIKKKDHFSCSFLGQKCYNFTHIPFWPGTHELNLSYTVC